MDYDLSSDLMFEIFSRVPLRTLTTCRLLSKEFNNLTYESCFMRTHCQRTKTTAGYFVQNLKYSRYYQTFMSIDNPADQVSLDFLPERVQILATVDQGLVFCVNQGLQNHHYICKPSTRQWENIPNPDSQSFTRKIGMLVLGSKPLRFKIVRLSEVQTQYSELELDDSVSELLLDDCKRYKCEIFDSDVWAWKQVEDVKLSYDVFFDSKPAISAYAGLHCLTWNSDENKSNLLSFYEEKESWELVSLPEPLCRRDNWDFVNLADYEGKLAVICVRPKLDFGELWIMKDFYGEKQWSKKHAVPLKQEIGHSLVHSFYNADVILLTGFCSAIFYNFKSGHFNSLELGFKHKYPQSTFFLRTDYEPIDLRKPKSFLSTIFRPPNDYYLACCICVLVFLDLICFLTARSCNLLACCCFLILLLFICCICYIVKSPPPRLAEGM